MLMLMMLQTCDKSQFQITGQYSVALPDGRIQTVTYSVRPETGYVVSASWEKLWEKPEKFDQGTYDISPMMSTKFKTSGQSVELDN